MPEGDTILHAARRVGAALVGREVLSIATPQPRHARDRWPERLAGRSVRSVDSHGKHLFLRFDGDLTLHSHLRMTGKWGVYRRGERWRRSPKRAWLVMRTAEHEVVEFDGPVLELMTESRTRFDQRLAALGPDIIRDDFDERVYLRRLREDDPTRPIGDALLDQRTVAGLGPVWRSEACFLAGVDPHRVTGTVGDEEALALVRGIREPMRASARGEGAPGRARAVYGRGGRPCPRCGTAVSSGTLWEDDRLVYWCPGCQR
jgi:endonuclease-8